MALSPTPHTYVRTYVVEVASAFEYVIAVAERNGCQFDWEDEPEPRFYTGVRNDRGQGHHDVQEDGGWLRPQLLGVKDGPVDEVAAEEVDVGPPGGSVLEEGSGGSVPQEGGAAEGAEEEEAALEGPGSDSSLEPHELIPPHPREEEAVAEEGAEGAAEGAEEEEAAVEGGAAEGAEEEEQDWGGETSEGAEEEGEAVEGAEEEGGTRAAGAGGVVPDPVVQVSAAEDFVAPPAAEVAAAGVAASAAGSGASSSGGFVPAAVAGSGAGSSAGFVRALSPLPPLPPLAPPPAMLLRRRDRGPGPVLEPPRTRQRLSSGPREVQFVISVK